TCPSSNSIRHGVTDDLVRSPLASVRADAPPIRRTLDHLLRLLGLRQRRPAGQHQPRPDVLVPGGDDRPPGPDPTPSDPPGLCRLDAPGVPHRLDGLSSVAGCPLLRGLHPRRALLPAEWSGRARAALSSRSGDLLGTPRPCRRRGPLFPTVLT